MASPTYICILRGINVSGHKKILMEDLKSLLEELGLQQPVTYIQSGNLVFEAPKAKDHAQLAQQIFLAIKKSYGFEVPVIIRSKTEFQHVIDSNPFLHKKGIDPEKLHVTFLAELPTAEALHKLDDIRFPPDQFVVHGKEVYLHCPENYGETKLSNQFFESKLKTSATTRNWKTVNKLMELASSR